MHSSLEVTTTTTSDELPFELLSDILQRLELPELLLMRGVSKRINLVILDIIFLRRTEQSFIYQDALLNKWIGEYLLTGTSYDYQPEFILRAIQDYSWLHNRSRAVVACTKINGVTHRVNDDVVDTILSSMNLVCNPENVDDKQSERVIEALNAFETLAPLLNDSQLDILLPACIKRLSDENFISYAMAALIASAAELNDKHVIIVVPECIARLCHTDVAVSFSAFEVLGVIKRRIDEHVLSKEFSECVRKLNDSNSDVRVAALRAMFFWGEKIDREKLPEAITAGIEKLVDKERSVRRIALNHIARSLPELTVSQCEQCLNVCIEQSKCEDTDCYDDALYGLDVLSSRLSGWQLDAAFLSIIRILRHENVKSFNVNVLASALQVLCRLIPKLNDIQLAIAASSCMKIIISVTGIDNFSSYIIFTTLAPKLSEPLIEHLFSECISNLNHTELITRRVWVTLLETLTARLNTDQVSKLYIQCFEMLSSIHSDMEHDALQLLVAIVPKLSQIQLGAALMQCIKRLNVNDSTVRTLALIILLKMTKEINKVQLGVVFSKCMEKLNDNYEHVRMAAFNALNEMAPRLNRMQRDVVVSAYLARLSHADSQICREAHASIIDIFPKLSARRCLPQLISACMVNLEGNDSYVRESAINTLMYLAYMIPANLIHPYVARIAKSLDVEEEMFIFHTYYDLLSLFICSNKCTYADLAIQGDESLRAKMLKLQSELISKITPQPVLTGNVVTLFQQNQSSPQASSALVMSGSSP